METRVDSERTRWRNSCLRTSRDVNGFRLHVSASSNRDFGRLRDVHVLHGDIRVDCRLGMVVDVHVGVDADVEHSGWNDQFRTSVEHQTIAADLRTAEQLESGRFDEQFPRVGRAFKRDGTWTLEDDLIASE